MKLIENLTGLATVMKNAARDILELIRKLKVQRATAFERRRRTDGQSRMRKSRHRRFPQISPDLPTLEDCVPHEIRPW